MMENNESINELILSGNNISHRGIINLIRLLSKNITLRKLDLTFNKPFYKTAFTPDIELQLETFVQLNNVSNYSQNTVLSQILEILTLDKIFNNDFIKYLKENTSLFVLQIEYLSENEEIKNHLSTNYMNYKKRFLTTKKAYN